MENINGIFKLEIDGTERELKCDFGTVENLERNLFRRPIITVLNEALNGSINVYEVVDTIMAGLSSNRDNRFDRKKIGAEVVKKGMSNYVEWYLSFLTYAVTGETEAKTEPIKEQDSEDKKKS